MSQGAPGVVFREASSPPAWPQSSERGAGGSVSGHSSVARERASGSSAPSGAGEGGGCSVATDSPCPRRFLGCFSLLITARSTT